MNYVSWVQDGGPGLLNKEYTINECNEWYKKSKGIKY